MNIKVLIIILSICVSFNSCKSGKVIGQAPGFDNGIFTLPDPSCMEHIPENKAIDSKIGQITCGDNFTFYYDYGKYSKKGTLTLEEDFIKAFDTYHHIKFFENRRIDPKVYKIFLDSVQIIKVVKKEASLPLMFDCAPCNVAALLTFKRAQYYFPYTVSEGQITKDYTHISFDTLGSIVYKYYTDENGLPALYATPIKNRYKSKPTLAVNFITTDNSDIQSMTTLLKGIRLKE